MEQRSEEWFKARKGRLTGSRIGAAMGLSPFMTRDELIREMVREHYGAPSEREESPAMAWGTSMEPVAKAALEDLIGMPIHECGFFTYGESLGASPDGIAADGAVVEIKAPYHAMMQRKKAAKLKLISEQPHYMAQVQLEMMCAKADQAYFFQWTPHGHKLEVIEKDAGFCVGILNEGRRFMRDFHACLEYPDHYLLPKVRHYEEPAISDEYRLSALLLERAKERHERARQKMIALVGDAEKAEIGGFMLTKVGKAGAISYAKAVKDLLPGADLEPYRGAASTSWMIKDKAQ